MNSIRHLLFGFVIAGASLSSGCGPDTGRMLARHDLPPADASWSSQVVAAEPDLHEGRTLSLIHAVEISLKHHPDVVASRSVAEAASAQVGEALAAYLPQVNASVSVSRGTSNTFVVPSNAGDPLTSGFGQFSQGGDASAESRTAQVSLSQLLFDAGKTGSAVRQGRAQARSSSLNWEVTRQAIAFSVRQGYFTVLQNEALLKVSEESLANFQKHLDEARKLKEVGRRTAYDVTTAEVNVSNAQIARLKAQNALATSRAQLNQALGLEEDPGYKLEEPPLQSLDIPLEAAAAQARASRPDLLAERANLEASEASVSGAWAGYWPNLSLTGNYSLSGPQQPPVRNWSIGPSLSWNWLNGFQTGSQVEAAQAQVRQERAKLASVEQKAYLDVRQAHLNLQEATQEMALADQTVKQAQEGHALAEGRYRAGLGTLLELTDSQVTLTQALAGRVRARADYEIGVAALLKAMGLLSVSPPRPRSG